MKKPDIPHDEQARLETLRSLNILDTLPEENFNRLTRIAKKLFGVPIALVSLVDENRQWFKSCIGVSVSETSRDISFCGHAILGNDLFIIPNAIEDARFVDNPLVVNDPNIRFYAGCPLSTPDGHKLGTLCIIDQKPRCLGKEDLEALVDLASMAERELSAMQLATMDELTRIPNRRGFMLLAQYSLHLCTREKLPASLVFMDLDNFKPVNDAFGHAEGDRVLAVFAEELSNTCRSSDIIGRLGGDEFAVLLVNASKARAEDVVARFYQSLKKFNQDSDRGYVVSFSYGVVEFNSKIHTLEALLADGDALMYQTKQSRR